MTVALATSINRYVGLSSDTKPTTGVPAGSTFYETDSQRTFVFNAAAWTVYLPTGVA